MARRVAVRDEERVVFGVALLAHGSQTSASMGGLHEARDEGGAESASARVAAVVGGLERGELDAVPISLIDELWERRSAFDLEDLVKEIATRLPDRAWRALAPCFERERISRGENGAHVAADALSAILFDDVMRRSEWSDFCLTMLIEQHPVLWVPAGRALAAAGDTRAVEPLLSILDRGVRAPSEINVFMAIMPLAELGDRRVTRHFLELLDDTTDLLLTDALCRGLGLLRDAGSLPKLCLLRDRAAEPGRRARLGEAISALEPRPRWSPPPPKPRRGASQPPPAR